MSSSAINAQLFQAKIGSIQNQADSSSVYSAGVWSFKNSTALTSVTITDAGNVGIGTTTFQGAGGIKLQVGSATPTTAGTLVKSTSSSLSLYASSTAASYQVWKTGTFMAFGEGPDDLSSFTERMRITASGDLLVGKTSSSITVAGVSISSDGFLGSSRAQSTNGASTFEVYSTTAAAYRFYVGFGGTIYATSTSISAISDVSLKENVRDLETGLSQVLALKPRRFDWKEETQIEQKNVAGFIAQEVEEVLPELVYEYKYNETETKKSLKMGDMLPTLVKAIQEQQAQIESLKAEVAALKAP